MSGQLMRAVLNKDEKGPAENLYIGDTPKPLPGPDQVLAKANKLSSDTLTVTVGPSASSRMTPCTSPEPR